MDNMHNNKIKSVANIKKALCNVQLNKICMDRYQMKIRLK